MKERYEGVDGLKAYAIIGIALMHILTNGEYGIGGFVFEQLIPSFTNLVFLFMMVSGFGMCCGYYQKFKDQKISVGEFYAKRYSKIWPYFALLCALDFVMSPSKSALYEVFANLTLCQGLLPNMNISVIGVSWTLAVIFVFYLLFPFFCFLLENKKRAWLALACAVIYNFVLALSGRNTTQIAYGMNELQFPTPGLYAKRKNLLMGSNPIIAPDSEMLWNAAIVWRILRRYEYTGALVMGRRKKIDVNTTSVRTLPEDKWIIAENAHEAIVTKDEYYQAQKAIRNVTPIQYKVGDDFALKGKICCGNCNRQLRHERQYGEMVFYCGYKRSAGKFSKCYGGYYREYSVNAKVARAIKTVFYALDVVNQGMQEKQSITVRCMDIEDLEKQAEAIRVEQIKLYESYADGVLLRDAYIEKKKALSEKLAALQDSIRTEKEEQECADELDEEIRALTKQASEKTYIGGLTKECVDAFVSMVYLYDDQTMKIEFNCEDVIRRALEKYGA